MISLCVTDGFRKVVKSLARNVCDTKSKRCGQNIILILASENTNQRKTMNIQLRWKDERQETTYYVGVRTGGRRKVMIEYVHAVPYNPNYPLHLAS